MKENPSPGEIIRQKLNLERRVEKRLDKLMEQAGFPKSLNSFPLRLARLDKALIADKTQNLPPDERIQWMRCLASGPFSTSVIQRITDLLKASSSQAHKAAGRAGLEAQERNRDKKRKKM